MYSWEIVFALRVRADGLSTTVALIATVYLYNSGMDSEQYQMGYKAGRQEGRALERDYWMPRYDNLLKQFQNSLVEAGQCKRLYESMKERMNMMLNRNI